MSRGSQMYAVRLGADLIRKIQEITDSRNKRRKKGTYTASDFIRQAIEEKLKHSARSRKTRRPAAIVCCFCDCIITDTGSCKAWTNLHGETEYVCSRCDAERGSGLR